MYGYISIKPIGSLHDTAMAIGDVLGLAFVEDRERRFQEFPAYFAYKGDVRYVILGIPDPKDSIRKVPRDDFQMMIEEDTADVTGTDTSEAIRKFQADGSIVFEFIT